MPHWVVDMSGLLGCTQDSSRLTLRSVSGASRARSLPRSGTGRGGSGYTLLDEAASPHGLWNLLRPPVGGKRHGGSYRTDAEAASLGSQPEAERLRAAMKSPRRCTWEAVQLRHAAAPDSRTDERPQGFGSTRPSALVAHELSIGRGPEGRWRLVGRRISTTYIQPA